MHIVKLWRLVSIINLIIINSNVHIFKMMKVDMKIYFYKKERKIKQKLMQVKIAFLQLRKNQRQQIYIKRKYLKG